MNQELEKIKQNVIKCTKCDLCKTRTNAVPGKGNFQSDVIFVGEAPGKNEDEHGEPFIGVAGKKLSIALDAAGITRDQVYITNIVKCRPPNNRVPKISEKDTCQEYLEQEISIIKPKIICHWLHIIPPHIVSIRNAELVTFRIQPCVGNYTKSSLNWGFFQMN